MTDEKQLSEDPEVSEASLTLGCGVSPLSEDGEMSRCKMRTAGPDKIYTIRDENGVCYVSGEMQSDVPSGDADQEYLERARRLGLSKSDLYLESEDDEDVAVLRLSHSTKLPLAGGTMHGNIAKSLSPISMRCRDQVQLPLNDIFESDDEEENVAKPAETVHTDTLPPKNWINDDAEREVFAIFLCVALNINRPAEFTSEMHPKTMIDHAVWIRPPCQIKRPQNAAVDYIVSRMPALYDISAADIEKHRAASRNFRDFLRTMIDLDKANHSSDPEVILRCKGRGCINDKFQKNNNSGSSLPCADCVHVELEKMTCGPRSALNGMFEGNAPYRNLKDVLESEIRGDNLSFGEIRNNALRAEGVRPDMSQINIHCGPRPGIIETPMHLPDLESEDEGTPQDEVHFRTPKSKDATAFQKEDESQLKPVLKQLAAAFGQLLPAPTKKVTIAITYES